MTPPRDALLWHVCVRKGTAIVPTVALTKAGYHLQVEPVRVARLEDPQSLAAAIEAAMSSGNPGMPTPTRANFPKPVILKYAGVKTWKAFERVGACFTILSGGEVKLCETGRDDHGNWMDDSTLDETLPADTTALEIAKRICARSARRDDLV